MRKGEDRRRTILETAEHLFYAQGFENTSVQDIIDALGFSKGGFYHHFESKLSLLEAICEDRAQSACALAEEAMLQCGSPTEKLNALFQRATILQTDSLDFISLLVRVAYREDGALMREKMKQQQLALNLPLMREVVREGIAREVFYSPFPDQLPELILRLGMQLTDEIAFQLARTPPNPEIMAVIFEKLKLYRHAMETLLHAPYGSVIIFHMAHMETICRAMLESPRAQEPPTER